MLGIFVYNDNNESSDLAFDVYRVPNAELCFTVVSYICFCYVQFKNSSAFWFFFGIAIAYYMLNRKYYV